MKALETQNPKPETQNPRCCELPQKALVPDADAVRLAALFKALGDPRRLQIVRTLARAGERCVCEINASFDLDNATLSHHLKVLRDAKLVTTDKRGLWIYYRIDPAAEPILRRLLGSSS